MSLDLTVYEEMLSQRESVTSQAEETEDAPKGPTIHYHLSLILPLIHYMVINSELLISEHLPDVAHVPSGRCLTWWMSHVVDVPHGGYPTWQVSHVVDVPRGRFPTWWLSPVGGWPTQAHVYLQLLFYQPTAQWTMLALSCEGQCWSWQWSPLSFRELLCVIIVSWFLLQNWSWDWNWD